MASIHSVIHEFEVLYSSRIVQKDKKWNDGKLRYYEFNGKLEIVNEDDQIIATDFNQSKNHKQFLETKLVVNNQFKLSSNKLVIEVLDKLLTYERDVVIRKQALTQVKMEPTPQVKLEPITPSLNGMTTPISLPRRLGLPRVKLEPKSPSIKALPSYRKVKIKKEPHNEEIDKIIKKPIILKNPNILRKQPKHHISPIILRDRTHTLPRIPPYSSRIFQHLGSKEQVKVKKEESIKSTTSVENADIIYDLSDFEEDERFLNMLQELKKARDVTEEQAPSSKANDAHDFDLSSNSDFDDIDLEVT